VGESSLDTNTGDAIHKRSKSDIHKQKLPYIGLTETYKDMMEPTIPMKLLKVRKTTRRGG